MTQPWLLTADIGGTNVRLTAFEGDIAIGGEHHSTTGPDDLVDMFARFAQSMGRPPTLVVAAVAGPVTDNRVRLTNAPKSLCGDDLREATGATAAYLINDFAAAAWATLRPGPMDVSCLQDNGLPQDGTHVVLGPGTGLGVGALFARKEIRYAVPGEGGHVGIAPQSRAEVEIFEAFRTLWPEVFFGDGLTCEAEAMLSGTGLPYLYRAVQRVTGDTSPPLDARGVLTAAQTGTAPAAGPAAEIFKSHLARLAGDLGLAFGATSVFLVGGVATKNLWLFDDAFVAAFNAGGRFTPLRQKMSLYLLRNPDFGLLGARNYAQYVLEQA